MHNFGSLWSERGGLGGSTQPYLKHGVLFKTLSKTFRNASDNIMLKLLVLHVSSIISVYFNYK